MSFDHRNLLRDIRTFPSFIKYLRDELDWPIESDDFEDLTFDYTPEELGIDSAKAAKIQDIKRLRPLSANQPWGIFFVKFEPKNLPVVALRRILSRVVFKKRASANSAERSSWALSDLLFVSNLGEGAERKISLAHFSHDESKSDLATLKVLGWEDRNTALHIDEVKDNLLKLGWPVDEEDLDAWRRQWRSAFTLGHRETITTSKNLAIRLADLARNIRVRINDVLEFENGHGPITAIMKAFQEALIHDLDEDGFADMYAQTIAYGLLSARVTNPDSNTAGGFAEQIPITNPFLKELMETLLVAGGRKGRQGVGVDFDELGISEVVELLDHAKMESVVRDFGDRNPLEDPVIHFYELFLTEYDPKKKIQRGVFYTPKPVVSFIVRSVDELLRSEFGLQDGLADTGTWGEVAQRIQDLKIPEHTDPEDPFVQILDPATGTGTFLVEMIEIIHQTLFKKWGSEGHGVDSIQQLWNAYVPDHLLPRLHGYEMMMAPYAIAHMKIGLKLYETGYRFRSSERARVYLTTALEPALNFDTTLAFAIPALAHEAQAVNIVKQEQGFTVVVGNPPYSKASANRSPLSEQLVAGYKEKVSEERNVQPLSDDYVKFIAFSESIIRKSGTGLVSMITNRGYLPGIIHRGMRECLGTTFPMISILDCHGDTNVGEAPPDGGHNENIFNIQQGVAICAFVRIPCETGHRINHGEVWGKRETKFSFLMNTSMETATKPLQSQFSPPNYLLSPRVSEYAEEYESQLKMTQIFGTGNAKADQGKRYGNGIKSNRDALLVGFTADEVVNRMSMLADPSISDREIRETLGLVDGPYWNTTREREKVRAVKAKDVLMPILYRPFCYRWIWYQKNLIQIGRGGASPGLMYQMLAGPNLALLTSRNPQTNHFSSAFVTDKLSEMKTAEATRASYCFPLFVYESQKDLYASHSANLSDVFVQRVAGALGLRWAGVTPGSLDIHGDVGAPDAFRFIYAQLHSNAYRSRYEGFLREDFPRIFLTKNLKMFIHLVRLGNDLVDIHLLKRTQITGHAEITVRGYSKQIEKVSFKEDTVWIDKNRTSGFQGVTESIWDFQVGGYKVCEKWLKDRGPKKGNLGRTLTDEDITHYGKIIVAISETIRIMNEIDEVIDEHGGWPDAFVTENTQNGN
jgi:predicted helicase